MEIVVKVLSKADGFGLWEIELKTLENTYVDMLELDGILHTEEIIIHHIIGWKRYALYKDAEECGGEIKAFAIFTIFEE